MSRHESDFIFSHVEKSVPGKLDACLAYVKGKRDYQEDAHILKQELADFPNVALFAVFDGHGYLGSGHVSAHFAEQNFVRLLLETEGWRVGARADNAEQLGAGLKDALLRIDAELRRSNHQGSGSTAVVTLVTPMWVVVANCGDSRAMVVRADGSVALHTEDHKPDAPVESGRIRSAGFTVTVDGYGVARVCSPDVQNGSALSVSRGLGDFFFKSCKARDGALLPPEQQPVSAVAEVFTHRREKERDAFLVLTCDGAWESLESDVQLSDVAQICVLRGAHWRPKTLAEEIIDAAKDRGSRDNISAMVVALPAAAQIAGYAGPLLLAGITRGGAPHASAAAMPHGDDASARDFSRDILREAASDVAHVLAASGVADAPLACARAPHAAWALMDSALARVRDERAFANMRAHLRSLELPEDGDEAAASEAGDAWRQHVSELLALLREDIMVAHEAGRALSPRGDAGGRLAEARVLACSAVREEALELLHFLFADAQFLSLADSRGYAEAFEEAARDWAAGRWSGDERSLGSAVGCPAAARARTARVEAQGALVLVAALRLGAVTVVPSVAALCGASADAEWMENVLEPHPMHSLLLHCAEEPLQLAQRWPARRYATLVLVAYAAARQLYSARARAVHDAYNEVDDEELLFFDVNARTRGVVERDRQVGEALEAIAAENALEGAGDGAAEGGNPLVQALTGDKEPGGALLRSLLLPPSTAGGDGDGGGGGAEMDAYHVGEDDHRPQRGLAFTQAMKEAEKLLAALTYAPPRPTYACARANVAHGPDGVGVGAGAPRELLMAEALQSELSLAVVPGRSLGERADLLGGGSDCLKGWAALDGRWAGAAPGAPYDAAGAAPGAPYDVVSEALASRAGAVVGGCALGLGGALVTKPLEALSGAGATYDSAEEGQAASELGAALGRHTMRDFQAAVIAARQSLQSVSEAEPAERDREGEPVMRPLAPPFQSQNHEGGETAVAARLFAACHGPDGELREQFWNRVRDECEPLEFVLRSAALAFPDEPGPLCVALGAAALGHECETWLCERTATLTLRLPSHVFDYSEWRRFDTHECLEGGGGEQRWREGCEVLERFLPLQLVERARRAAAEEVDTLPQYTTLGGRAEARPEDMARLHAKHLSGHTLLRGRDGLGDGNGNLWALALRERLSLPAYGVELLPSMCARRRGATALDRNVGMGVVALCVDRDRGDGMGDVYVVALPRPRRDGCGRGAPVSPRDVALAAFSADCKRVADTWAAPEGRAVKLALARGCGSREAGTLASGRAAPHFDLYYRLGRVADVAGALAALLRSPAAPPQQSAAPPGAYGRGGDPPSWEPPHLLRTADAAAEALKVALDCLGAAAGGDGCGTCAWAPSAYNTEHWPHAFATAALRAALPLVALLATLAEAYPAAALPALARPWRGGTRAGAGGELPFATEAALHVMGGVETGGAAGPLTLGLLRTLEACVRHVRATRVAPAGALLADLSIALAARGLSADVFEEAAVLDDVAARRGEPKLTAPMREELRAHLEKRDAGRSTGEEGVAQARTKFWDFIAREVGAAASGGGGGGGALRAHLAALAGADAASAAREAAVLEGAAHAARDALALVAPAGAVFEAGSAGALGEGGALEISGCSLGVPNLGARLATQAASLRILRLLLTIPPGGGGGGGGAPLLFVGAPLAAALLVSAGAAPARDSMGATAVVALRCALAPAYAAAAGNRAEGACGRLVPAQPVPARVRVLTLKDGKDDAAVISEAANFVEDAEYGGSGAGLSTDTTADELYARVVRGYVRLAEAEAARRSSAARRRGDAVPPALSDAEKRRLLEALVRRPLFFKGRELPAPPPEELLARPELAELVAAPGGVLLPPPRGRNVPLTLGALGLSGDVHLYHAPRAREPALSWAPRCGRCHVPHVALPLPIGQLRDLYSADEARLLCAAATEGFALVNDAVAALGGTAGGGAAPVERRLAELVLRLGRDEGGA